MTREVPERREHTCTHFGTNSCCYCGGAGTLLDRPNSPDRLSVIYLFIRAWIYLFVPLQDCEMMNGMTRSLCTFEDIRNQDHVSVCCHLLPSFLSPSCCLLVDEVTDRWGFGGCASGLHHLLQPLSLWSFGRPIRALAPGSLRIKAANICCCHRGINSGLPLAAATDQTGALSAQLMQSFLKQDTGCLPSMLCWLEGQSGVHDGFLWRRQTRVNQSFTSPE